MRGNISYSIQHKVVAGSIFTWSICSGFLISTRAWQVFVISYLLSALVKNTVQCTVCPNICSWFAVLWFGWAMVDFTHILQGYFNEPWPITPLKLFSSKRALLIHNTWTNVYYVLEMRDSVCSKWCIFPILLTLLCLSKLWNISILGLGVSFRKATNCTFGCLVWDYIYRISSELWTHLWHYFCLGDLLIL